MDLDYPAIPQLMFYFNVLLRSEICLKECPPSTSISNKDLPLSSKPLPPLRMCYTHYKVQITLLLSGLR